MSSTTLSLVLLLAFAHLSLAHGPPLPSTPDTIMESTDVPPTTRVYDYDYGGTEVGNFRVNTNDIWFLLAVNVMAINVVLLVAVVVKCFRLIRGKCCRSRREIITGSNCTVTDQLDDESGGTLGDVLKLSTDSFGVNDGSKKIMQA